LALCKNAERHLFAALSNAWAADGILVSGGGASKLSKAGLRAQRFYPRLSPSLSQSPAC